MRPFVAPLLVACLVTSVAAASAPTFLAGKARVREDAGGRIVVALDVDLDGRVDHLFLLDPVEPLALPFPGFEGHVRIALDDGTFSLDAADGSGRLILGVRAKPEGLPANETTHGILEMYGRAIQHRIYSGGPFLEDVDTSTIVTVVDSDCGESDADCQNGGRLSTGCAVTCLGGGAQGATFGVTFSAQACSTFCLPGAYGCCSCKALRQTPECTCRSVDALKPCDDAPAVPLPEPDEPIW